MCEITEILNQIAEQTKPDNKVIWIAAITSISTLIAAGVGAILLYKGTLNQIKATSDVEEKKLKASIVTTERLRWLQDLRQQSSEFYANLDMHYNLLKRSVPEEEIAKNQEKMDKFAEKVMVQSNAIYTMLNPKREHQNVMRESSNQALEHVLKCVEMRNQGNLNFSDNAYQEIKNRFFGSLTEIGTETWNQVRDLT